MILIARQFAIALSSNGTLGLITSPEMVEHQYPEGNTKKVWTGVVLSENSFIGQGKDTGKQVQAKAGDFWSSSSPKVIGYVEPQDIASLVT